ncbi:MAG: alpha-galactosidase, partial [Lachnospiraceae bacterium]|nr:alpha-galactosidase [Lachnospiraceae bacterium]
MPIYIDEKELVFHLKTPNTSYIMKVWHGKYLAHVYWGKKIDDFSMENALLSRTSGWSPMTDKEDYTLDFICQEYPTGCGTDYRIPAISAVYDDGSRTVELVYEGDKLSKGKAKLKGLPATYVESEEEAETLEITLRDRVKNLKVVLMYTVFNDYDAIARSVRVVNESDKDILLEKVLSGSVDFEDSDYDLVTLSGAWGRERRIERGPIRSGIQSASSNRGSSSHYLNPFFAMCSKNANEEYGDVYGYSLVYSGSFTAGVEVDLFYKSRAYMGINDYDFSWKLEPNDEFTAPEMVMVYSDAGFGKMSRTFHKLYRKRLVRGKYRDEVRPILVNNWEATYFDFTEEKIVNLAKAAKELGIELLVLDDGWFGKRNGDDSSLGDWYVNREKLPLGIDGLAKRVNEEGLKFGLWLEPEMVSVDSDLYRAHPDWCIHVPERVRCEARNQLILDLSRKEVCDYIKDTVNRLLKEANISYVKWDMNRNMSQFGSAG